MRCRVVSETILDKGYYTIQICLRSSDTILQSQQISVNLLQMENPVDSKAQCLYKYAARITVNL